MHKTSTLAALLIVAALAAPAAADTVALHADFDLDTPELPPATDLPGAPEGDALTLYTQGGDITVEESVGTIGGQPLLLDRQDGTLSFGLNAQLAPDEWYRERYTVRWRSAVMSNVFFFGIGARSGNSQLLASVEYRSGGGLSFNSSAHPCPVGYQPGVMQEFEINLDMVNKKASLRIDGVDYPELQGLNQYQLGGNGMRLMTFGPGGVDAHQFVVDDIEVIAGDANTAVEATTWSRVKALF